MRYQRHGPYIDSMFLISHCANIALTFSQSQNSDWVGDWVRTDFQSKNWKRVSVPQFQQVGMLSLKTNLCLQTITEAVGSHPLDDFPQDF